MPLTGCLRRSSMGAVESQREDVVPGAIEDCNGWVGPGGQWATSPMMTAAHLS
jgi:hypothetical protein